MTPKTKRDWSMVAVLLMALGMLVSFIRSQESYAGKTDVIENTGRIGVLETDSSANKVDHERIYQWQQSLDTKIDTLLTRSARNH